MIGSVSVASTAVAVLPPPSQGSYQFIAVANTGSNPAYLKFTPDADPVTTTNGIVLPPGASILVDQDDSPVLLNGISAVCAAGQSTNLAVQAY